MAISYSTDISLDQARGMYRKFLTIKEKIHTSITTDVPLDDECKRFLMGKAFFDSRPPEPPVAFSDLNFEIAFFFTKEMITKFATAMEENENINGVALTLAAWDTSERDNDGNLDVGRPTLISSLCSIVEDDIIGGVSKITLYDLGDTTTTPHIQPKEIDATTTDATIVGKEHPIGGKYNGTTDQLFKNPLSSANVHFMINKNKGK